MHRIEEIHRKLVSAGFTLQRHPPSDDNLTYTNKDSQHPQQINITCAMFPNYQKDMGPRNRYLHLGVSNRTSRITEQQAKFGASFTNNPRPSHDDVVAFLRRTEIQGKDRAIELISKYKQAGWPTVPEMKEINSVVAKAAHTFLLSLK
ncbi:TPA: hypothetical protein HA244_04465 [Candidatus Micrarchaeota archaeon]|nr:hypothetical protein [Candidatus Micrarchaeota archaeon]